MLNISRTMGKKGDEHFVTNENRQNNNNSSHYDVRIEEDTVDIREIFRILRRGKWTILLLTILCVIPSGIYSYKRPATFRASAKLLIEKETPDVVSFKEVMETDMSDKEEYASQIEILKSYPIAQAVIERLHLDAAALEKTSFSLQAYFLGTLSFIKTWMGTPDDVVTSEATAAILQEEKAVGLLSRRITISQLRGSRLLSVSADSTDPEQAARIVNTVVDVYIERTLEDKASASKDAVSWLVKEVEEAKQKMQESELALQRYKEEHEILSLQDRQNIVMQKLSELNSSLHKARVQRMEAEVEYQRIKNLSKDELQVLPQIFNDPLIQKLKIDAATLESQLSETLEKFREKHPLVEAMKSQINGVYAQIDIEAQRILKSLKMQYDIALGQEQVLIEALDLQKGEVQALNEKTIEYNVLDREVESNRNLYNTLLQRMKETSLTERLKTSNIRIVERAGVPRGPIAPKKNRNIVLAAILGIFLGISFVWFFETMDTRLRSLEDVRRHLDIPTLGFIPKMTTIQNGRGKQARIAETSAAIVGLITLVDAKSNIAEAYRNLRTHVTFSALGKQAIILVTSSNPGEGKSSVAANLSISLAQSGRKTLLIDCDFRRPMIAQIFHPDIVVSGLAELLIQDEIGEVWNSIHSTDIQNLDILPSGAIPPNPSELLSQEKTALFLKALGERYEKIILDSPPVNAVTDPLILSELADGVIFVIKAGATTVDEARHALYELRNSKENIWGGVLNMVDLKKEGYYYYSYKKNSYYNTSEQTS